MTWMFNAPPGWPQPPSDWVPPDDWTPDPSWPAPPSGWDFWRRCDVVGTGATPAAHSLVDGAGVPDTVEIAVEAREHATVGDAVSTHYRPSAYSNDVKWALAGLRRSGWGFLVGLSTWGPGLLLPYLFFPAVVLATIVGFSDGGVLGAMIAAALAIALGLLVMATSFISLPIVLIAEPFVLSAPSLIAILVGDVLGWVALVSLAIWLEPYLNRISGARQPSARERERVGAIVERVVRQAGLAARPRLMIQDQPQVNASMGARILTLNTGLGLHYDAPDGLSDDQIEAIIAHELGHWVHADSIGMWVNHVLLLPLRVWAAAGTALTVSRRTSIIGALMLWGPRVYFRFLIGPLNRRAAYRAEYEADQFAASRGHGPALCAFLDSIPDHRLSPQSWGDLIASTHPPVELRIDRLRSIETAAQ